MSIGDVFQNLEHFSFQLESDQKIDSETIARFSQIIKTKFDEITEDQGKLLSSYLVDLSKKNKRKT